jgi:hypothetical protein
VSLLANLARRQFPSRTHGKNWSPPHPRRSCLKTSRRLVAILTPIVTVTVSFVAVTAWIVANGDLTSSPADPLDWLRISARTDLDNAAAGHAPVHIASTPTGAEVRVDGSRRGPTPLVLALSPGAHELTLQHSEAFETEQTLDVPASGIDIAIPLWRRRPDILPVRPVYRGADLVDAPLSPTAGSPLL